ncbi:hypothetical protein FOQG_12621 [Fusarium oxysporum f. sp. raphani 54005]|uniref:Uncharacterized protein n=2 Tax=Fusarium oxysporum TaxID=5507 RepID=X0CKM3_FUSOX|nr:hypothetical protein FOVG_05420 [Fusarium oxysporum f. sp. pisi HDV247]EXK83102.1 hypothetical protein FOQG_12621 [Fusarium oxysporum f. sp. raphani 54005]KAJ4030364.1 hypothetical protein NW753_013903 [Fusarium oxysporum]KAJ4068942.1 hypothetical protein NW763_002507 [Fusarium oxysporum]KAJ4081366.1 hypothetical protein NW756_010244 [Fusarium oxysporum]
MAKSKSAPPSSTGWEHATAVTENLPKVPANLESARKRIKLEEGKPSFSADQCIVIDAHIKEERVTRNE